MKIEKINIKNFKGIRNFEGEIGGKHVYLVGGNATGKTSFIDAVWCGLTGKNLPPEPTTDGAKKGLIEIDLGDFIARTKITKGRPTRFELENKEYTKESERFIKSPRSYMESRVGILDFDINEFFSKSDAEQVKYFAKVMDSDFSDIDSDIEEIMESRKFDKKKLAEIQTKENYYSKEDAERDYIDVVELSKKIEEEKEKSDNYDRIRRGVGERQNEVAKKEAEIERLKAEIKTLNQEADDGLKWLETEENKPNDELIVKMREDLNNSKAVNEKIREAKEAQEAEKQADEFKKMIQEQTDEIDALKAKKSARISENINIEGLTYDVNEERFLWNGLPFDRKQINTASQLIAGLKIGSMMLNDLKILKVDASLIDKVNFDEVLAWASEQGIELFVELVDREAAQLEIIVHDENE